MVTYTSSQVRGQQTWGGLQQGSPQRVWAEIRYDETASICRRPPTCDDRRYLCERGWVCDIDEGGVRSRHCKCVLGS